jgi:hypothetical protein
MGSQGALGGARRLVRPQGIGQSGDADRLVRVQQEHGEQSARLWGGEEVRLTVSCLHVERAQYAEPDHFAPPASHHARDDRRFNVDLICL